MPKTRAPPCQEKTHPKKPERKKKRKLSAIGGQMRTFRVVKNFKVSRSKVQGIGHICDSMSKSFGGRSGKATKSQVLGCKGL